MKIQFHWDWLKSFFRRVLYVLLALFLLLVPISVFLCAVYFICSFVSSSYAVLFCFAAFAIIVFSLYILAGLFGFLDKAAYDAVDCSDDDR